MSVEQRRKKYRFGENEPVDVPVNIPDCGMMSY